MISSNKFYFHRENICFEEIEKMGGNLFMKIILTHDLHFFKRREGFVFKSTSRFTRGGSDMKWREVSFHLPF
jgi:hypothetical protein